MATRCHNTRSNRCMACNSLIQARATMPHTSTLRTTNSHLRRVLAQDIRARSRVLVVQACNRLFTHSTRRRAWRVRLHRPPSDPLRASVIHKRLHNPHQFRQARPFRTLRHPLAALCVPSKRAMPSKSPMQMAMPSTSPNPQLPLRLRHKDLSSCPPRMRLRRRHEPPATITTVPRVRALHLEIT